MYFKINFSPANLKIWVWQYWEAGGDCVPPQQQQHSPDDINDHFLMWRWELLRPKFASIHLDWDSTPIRELPSSLPHHQGIGQDDYCGAKTLMRGLSTYFKGSFEFSRTIFTCQISWCSKSSQDQGRNFPLISGYSSFCSWDHSNLETHRDWNNVGEFIFLTQKLGNHCNSN